MALPAFASSSPEKYLSKANPFLLLSMFENQFLFGKFADYGFRQFVTEFDFRRALNGVEDTLGEVKKLCFVDLRSAF
jgi:hypothetical protein